MSQVFSGDSVQLAASATVAVSTETTIVTGNFLNPPFQNAKAVVSASITVSTGTGSTGFTLRIRRNPNAENLQVVTSGGITVATATNYLFSFQCADAIPDGRPVQYALTVQQSGASATGIAPMANISTFLISG